MLGRLHAVCRVKEDTRERAKERERERKAMSFLKYAILRARGHFDLNKKLTDGINSTCLTVGDDWFWGGGGDIPLPRTTSPYS